MTDSIPRISLFSTYSAYLLGTAWALGPLALYFLPRGPRGEYVAPYSYVGLTLWAALPIAMLVIALLHNRAGFASWGVGRHVKNGILLVLEWLLWLVALQIPLAIFLPSFGDYSVRAKVSEMILAASTARTAVTENAQNLETLVRSGDNLSFGPGPNLSAGVVAKNGMIVVYSAKVLALAVFEPRYVDGHVLWQCDVLPAKSGPSTCRTDGGDIPLSSTSRDRKVPGTASEHAVRLRAAAAPVQSEVARRAEGRDSLRDVVQTRLLPRDEVMDFGLLDADGIVLAYSDMHGVFMLLEPTLEDGTVTWRCRLWPQEAKAAGCENPRSQSPPIQSPTIAHAHLQLAESDLRFEVRDTGVTTIGRRDPAIGALPDVDLNRVELGRTVSRRHASIERVGDRFVLRVEPGTTNETYLNYKTVERGKSATLAPGDRIRLGGVVLFFREGSVPRAPGSR